MSETRKLAAILVADVVGYSRLTESRRGAHACAPSGPPQRFGRSLRAAPHRGRIVKRTGDGSIIEFRSVVDAVRCAIEVQNGMADRNAGVAPERRIEFRVGIHLGDVVEEADGDLMGDGVNIAARLESIAKPGAICLSENAYRQVSGRLDMIGDENSVDPVLHRQFRVLRSDNALKHDFHASDVAHSFDGIPG